MEQEEENYMANIIILKKSGEEISIPIKEKIIEAWMILCGLKFDDAISEQTTEVQDPISENYKGIRRNPVQDWAVFTDLKDKKLVINKRYVAFIRE